MADRRQPFFLTYVMSTVYSFFIIAWLPSRIFEQVSGQKRGLLESLKPSNLFDAEDRYILKTATVISLPYFLCGLTWCAASASPAAAAVADRRASGISLFQRRVYRPTLPSMTLLSCLCSFSLQSSSTTGAHRCLTPLRGLAPT